MEDRLFPLNRRSGTFSIRRHRPIIKDLPKKAGARAALPAEEPEPLLGDPTVRSRRRIPASVVEGSTTRWPRTPSSADWSEGRAVPRPSLSKVSESV